MLILVRHCAAVGQSPEAGLSEEGRIQSSLLANELAGFFKVTRIISSPFRRAVESVEPLAEKFGLKIACDELLRERFFINTTLNYNEWAVKLKASFEDMSYKACDEGESNSECQARAFELLQRLNATTPTDDVTVVVSHGNFIAMLLSLNLGNQLFGYDRLMSLSNPDVFLLNLDPASAKIAAYERIWNASPAGLAVRNRISSRAILFDSAMQNVLLFRLYNKHTLFNGKAPASLWITPGGGVEEDEDLVQGLERELMEELGLLSESFTIKGHLWRSDNKTMIYKNRPCKCIDNYFVVQLASDSQSFDFSKWTDEEKLVLNDMKWWSLDELRRTADKVAPPQLRHLASKVDPIIFEQIVEID